MAHHIIYELIWPRDGFKSMRLVWEPVSDYVSLHFRNDREAVTGMAKPLAEMIEYFDRRALDGPPWNGPLARNARERLAELMGEETPPAPSESAGPKQHLRRIS